MNTETRITYYELLLKLTNLHGVEGYLPGVYELEVERLEARIVKLKEAGA